MSSAFSKNLLKAEDIYLIILEICMKLGDGVC